MLYRKGYIINKEILLSKTYIITFYWLSIRFDYGQIESFNIIYLTFVSRTPSFTYYKVSGPFRGRFLIYYNSTGSSRYLFFTYYNKLGSFRTVRYTLYLYGTTLFYRIIFKFKASFITLPYIILRLFNIALYIVTKLKSLFVSIIAIRYYIIITNIIKYYDITEIIVIFYIYKLIIITLL